MLEATFLNIAQEEKITLKKEGRQERKKERVRERERESESEREREDFQKKRLKITEILNP